MHIKNFDPYDFNKTEISGVPVYWKNLPWAPCIHCRIVIKTGGLDDPEGKEGITHFLEHMFYQGSSKFTDEKAIAIWAKLHTFNTLNATTHLCFTGYRFECLPESFFEAISGLTDMVFNPLISVKSVEEQRKVIIRETWNHYTNEKFLNYLKEYVKNIFNGHTHSRIYSTAGWPNTVSGISQEDIVKWHKMNYGRGNFFIVLCGAVEKKHLEKLEDILKDIPMIIPPEKPIQNINKPKNRKIIKKSEDIGASSEQASLMIKRVAPPFSETKNQTILSLRDLIKDILVERIRREQGLCYSVNVMTFLEKTYLEAWMHVKSDENNIEIIEREFWNILKEVQEGKHRERFVVTKRIALEYLRAAERLSSDIARDTMFDVFKHGRSVPLNEEISNLEKVTYDDVATISKEIFDPEYVYTEIILPSKKS